MFGLLLETPEARQSKRANPTKCTFFLKDSKTFRDFIPKLLIDFLNRMYYEEPRKPGLGKFGLLKLLIHL